ncbi:MAG TPA: phenylalanine--tRNA ligase subunit alpha [Thermoanaerobaculia bacterium]|nr:phenylalanine--tRNA ligase subunit alpha [Thermoanaerobaculia bacterium]
MVGRFRRDAEAVSGRDAWEALRVEWLGRKRGIVRSLEARLRELEPAERREFGKGVHELRREVETALEALDRRLAERERERALAGAAVDVTVPGRRQPTGTLHPITLVYQEIESIFRQMGYSVAEGPEIEDDYHNFGALNFPDDHPARDEQDTLFLRDGRLLRTHTSPIQVRTLLARKPPVRVLGIGRVYRNDNTLRHSPMFHQVEALVVDRGITFGHLKGAIETFFKRLLDPETSVRLRPSYFPFTEPSAEVDITCPFCRPPADTASCGTCSGTGWMEIMGSGMVDPRVLENLGVDPEVWSGFAFGGGIDRVAMARYGLPNIRMLFENDLRLLRQIHR